MLPAENNFSITGYCKQLLLDERQIGTLYIITVEIISIKYVAWNNQYKRHMDNVNKQTFLVSSIP